MVDKKLLEDAHRALNNWAKQPADQWFQSMIDRGIIDEQGKVNLWWDAKYAIVAVKRGNANGRIDKFRCLMPYKDNPGAAEVDISRENLIQEMNNGSSVITATLDEKNRRWREGEPVVLADNGYLHLKTISNEELTDNLGELPEFPQTTSRR